MKLVVSGFLFVLSITALQAQNAANPVVSTAPLGGYSFVYPQAPLVTIHFDGNSEDIAKVLSVPHAGTSFNHDGTAFNGYVRSTPSESYSYNVADYVQRDRDIAEYQKNVQSGKWTRFVNGE